METIEVRYQQIGVINGAAYYHQYIIYTDINGNQWAARGGPSESPIGDQVAASVQSELRVGPSPYGPITTEYGSYSPGFADFNPNNSTEPREVIKSGSDLSQQWGDIKRAMDDISSEQHTYRPYSSNSNSTVNEALKRAGLDEPLQDGAGGYWSPGSQSDLPVSNTPDTGGDPITGMPWPGNPGGPPGTGGTIAPTCGRDYAGAKNWVPPRRDPLVLDLDGGGITTSAINPAAPIYFDQDGDGTLTATGWIGAGEAIVVRDLNGNGVIDSGRELFGDSTVLTHGPNAGQLAANGFAALADLDSNTDGKFDASDADFASVKLWKDLNQNGISETNELFTLAQLGVQSINLSATASNTALLDPTTGAATGNTQTFAGSFTQTGGTTGDAGTAQLAGSLLLSNDNFYRQFTDDPALTAQALNLPQMQGSGAVRDLRPAMSLGGDKQAQAQALQAQLTQFAADTTRTQQLAHLDALIQSWGATSAMPTSLQTNLTLANPADGAGRVCGWRGLFSRVIGFKKRISCTRPSRCRCRIN